MEQILKSHFSLIKDGGDPEYIKLKVTKYCIDAKERTILQFINITADVLQDKVRSENQLLEMINACVSHELRNPLNSIHAQNVEKDALYSQLEKAI